LNDPIINIRLLLLEYYLVLRNFIVDLDDEDDSLVRIYYKI